MTGDYETGSLTEFHSENPDARRPVNYRFDDGVSGDLRVLAGGALVVGEIYLLAAGDRHFRVEVLKLANPPVQGDGPGDAYQFRVV